MERKSEDESLKRGLMIELKREKGDNNGKEGKR
jgi:hypothetical protein